MGEPETPRARSNGSLLQAAPGLVRIAAAAWWRTAGWTVETSVRIGSRLMEASVSGQSPAQLFQDGGAELRAYVRRVLGIVESELREDEPPEPESGERESTNASLRKRGEELLRRSADVDYHEEAHPAYGRILDQLAPDEGRILRLLALEGPQASVDIRAGWLPVDAASELIAPGLTMIGAAAGCRDPDRVHQYLNNLYRLGLVWFSREALKEQAPYQVLEAQPEVVEAMKEDGRTRTVRRSIHLTPFGEDFCETCLPLHTAELEALPGGGVAEPGETPQPES
jgi:Abortive infection alpha